MGEDFFSDPLSFVGAAVGGTVGFFMGGPLGAVAGAGLGMMAASTVEGIATGRMFSSPMAFLFEPTRAICALLGITDKTIVQGFLSVSKVYHENQYPDTLVRNCISRNKDGSDLLTYYYNFAKVGQAQFDKYYVTGKKRFMDHLPTCNVLSATVPYSTVEAAINNDLNVTSTVHRIDLGYPTNDDWVKYVLQNQGKYNYSTDIVTIDNKQYEINKTDYNASTNKIDIYLQGINGNAHKTTISIDSAEVTSYITATYTTTTNNNAKIWIHKTNLKSLGVDFDDDDTAKMLKNDLVCLPVVCLRNDKVDLEDAENNSDCSESFRAEGRYKQSKKVLASIGLPIDEVTKQYKDLPDMNKVYDIYFMAGISPKQTIDDAEKDPEGNKYSVEMVAKYLFDSVKFIYEKLVCAIEGQPYFINFEEAPLRGQVCWAGVPPKTINGTKCKHGHYVMELGDSAKEHYKVILQRVHKYNGEKQVTHTSYDIDGNSISSTTSTVHEYEVDYSSLELANKPITPKKIFDNLENRIPFFPDRTNSSKSNTLGYAKENPSFPETIQLSEPIAEDLPIFRILKTTQSTTYDSSTDSYEQTVSYSYDSLSSFSLNTALDIQSYVTVWKEPSSITLYHQDTRYQYTQLTLRNITSFYYTESVGDGLLQYAHADESNFIFPISHIALKNLSVYEKNKFFSESFYLLFFAKEEQHLAFYETPEFGTFLQIVGVAITIIVTVFTWGSATVTVQAAIQSMIQMAAVYVGVTLALQVIAAVVPDATMKAILSAAVMVAAIYFGGGFDNFNLSTAVQLAEVPAKAVDIYTKDQMKALQQEAADFQSRYQEAQKQVEQASGQLTYGIDTQDVLATQEFARSWDGRVMSREEFYTITLTCPDLYSVCQDQIDRSKTVDLDTIYPLYDM